MSRRSERKIVRPSLFERRLDANEDSVIPANSDAAVREFAIHLPFGGWIAPGGCEKRCSGVQKVL
jgi:hypothetical protein